MSDLFSALETAPKPKKKVQKPKIKLNVSAPEHLDSIAREKWTEILQKLETLGNDGSIDTDLLAMYCVAWRDFIHFGKTAHLFEEKKEALLVTLDLNILQQRKHYDLVNNAYNQAIAKQNRAMKMLLDFGDKLGLNPSSRKRQKLDGSQKENPFLRFSGSR